jgi:hypothetical protein
LFQNIANKNKTEVDNRFFKLIYLKKHVKTQIVKTTDDSD